MTILVSEVYDAFREAGVSEEKSRAAASALASYEHRFAAIERRLAVVQWMCASIIAGVAAIIINDFFV